MKSLPSLTAAFLLLVALLISCAQLGADTEPDIEAAPMTLDPASSNLTGEAARNAQDIDPKFREIIRDGAAEDNLAAALYSSEDGVRFELGGIRNGRYRVSLRARGDEYEGWPVARLFFEDEHVGESTVESATYTERDLATLELKREQVLEVFFTNDKWGGTPETDRNLYIDHLTLTPVEKPGVDTYEKNLARIKASSLRNRNEDDSRFLDTPMAELPVDKLLGPRADYRKYGEHHPNGFDVAGNFRTTCEFSHFAYDDPIIYPGQPEVAHLHMFFGNTDVNAHSTYDTLVNSGGGTCNGSELNRTGYWAPAMFDAQGNVRVPSDIYIYYKGYGDAMKNGEIEVYPEGLAIVSDPEANAQDEDGMAFKCISHYGGDIHNESPTIPVCRGGIYEDGGRGRLEMNLKFQQCWNGQDPTNYKDNLSVPLYSWFSGICPDSHPIALPNLRVRIGYDVEAGEDTNGWYLASDVNPQTFTVEGPRGKTFHSDWWGGWHPGINREWIDSCTNVASSGCGSGYLADAGDDPDNVPEGRALKLREQYEGPVKVPAAQLFEELCSAERTLKSPAGAAYCRPAVNELRAHTH